MSFTYCRQLVKTPAAIIIIRHIMTSFSLVVAPLCVYIVKSSSSVTRVYSNLLVGLLIGSVAVDVFIQWVFDPLFLNPMLCVMRADPLFNIPLSAAVCAAIAFSFVALGGPAYFALFIYRHQTLVPAGSRYKFAVSTQALFVLTLSPIFLAFGPSFYMGQYPATESDIIRERMSDELLAVIEKVDCFRMKNLYLYYALGVILPTFTVIFIVVIARHIFSLLKEVKHISNKTQQLFRNLTRSLVVQALVPVVTVILPFGMIGAFTFSSAERYLASMDFLGFDLWDLLILAVSTHAVAHISALILTTPIFRNRLYGMLRMRRMERSSSESHMRRTSIRVINVKVR